MRLGALTSCSAIAPWTLSSLSVVWLIWEALQGFDSCLFTTVTLFALLLFLKLCTCFCFFCNCDIINIHTYRCISCCYRVITVKSVIIYFSLLILTSEKLWNCRPAENGDCSRLCFQTCSIYNCHIISKTQYRFVCCCGGPNIWVVTILNRNPTLYKKQDILNTHLINFFNWYMLTINDFTLCLTFIYVWEQTN